MTRAFNQKFVKNKRRALRKYATYAEKILWLSLKNKGIDGVRFLRQYSVNKFIIDFYSPALKLGIEVDGESHIGREQYDKDRQEFIESYGLKIIRFTDDEIIGNINKVVDTITNFVKEQKTHFPIPSPFPPRRTGPKRRVREGFRGKMKKNNYIIIILFLSIRLIAQTDTSLVLIKSLDSTLTTDVKYATEYNFTKKVLYPSANVYLRHDAAVQLIKVNDFLKRTLNYRLKIFDGYRPLSVQKIMWKILPDERFVANPAKGSRHNRGCAVDVTLIDSNGLELEMGTPYDDFTEKAAPECPDISDRAKANRKILNLAMIQYGFLRLDTEWWHFDYTGWEKYSILDEPIR